MKLTCLNPSNFWKKQSSLKTFFLVSFIDSVFGSGRTTETQTNGKTWEKIGENILLYTSELAEDMY